MQPQYFRSIIIKWKLYEQKVHIQKFVTFSDLLDHSS